MFMKAKKIFFTAILAVFTLFASSCDKDEPINSRVPYGFRFYYVDEEGKPLITEDNFDLFISKFTIIDNGAKISLVLTITHMLRQKNKLIQGE